jgi:hypothetical protein
MSGKEQDVAIPSFPDTPAYSRPTLYKSHHPAVFKQKKYFRFLTYPSRQKMRPVAQAWQLIVTVLLRGRLWFGELSEENNIIGVPIAASNERFIWVG